MHLTDYFHITNMPTKPTDKASSIIHMASSLLHVNIQPAIVQLPIQLMGQQYTALLVFKKMMRMLFAEEELLRLILLLK